MICYIFTYHRRRTFEGLEVSDGTCRYSSDSRVFFLFFGSPNYGTINIDGYWKTALQTSFRYYSLSKQNQTKLCACMCA